MASRRRTWRSRACMMEEVSQQMPAHACLALVSTPPRVAPSIRPAPAHQRTSFPMIPSTRVRQLIPAIETVRQQGRRPSPRFRTRAF